MKKKRILEICLNGVLLLVTIGLLAPSIMRLRPELIGADYSLLVVGKSMEPNLSHGDTLFVKKDGKEIKVGDIIAIEANPIRITHRVINIANVSALFLTKGDANEFPDGWVSEDRIIGKVIYKIPTSFLFTLPGCFLLIILPIISIAARVVYVFLKKMPQSEQKRGLEAWTVAILNPTTSLLIFIAITSFLMLVTAMLATNIYFSQDAALAYNEIFRAGNG